MKNTNKTFKRFCNIKAAVLAAFILLLTTAAANTPCYAAEAQAQEAEEAGNTEDTNVGRSVNSFTGSTVQAILCGNDLTIFVQLDYEWIEPERGWFTNASCVGFQANSNDWNITVFGPEHNANKNSNSIRVSFVARYSRENKDGEEETYYAEYYTTFYIDEYGNVE